MRALRTIIVLCAVLLTLGSKAFAIGEMQLVLAPHCEEVDRTRCTVFDVTSPTSMSTKKLSAGDILDIDILVTGNDYKNVRSVRSWLEYDPAVLEGRSVEITDAITSPTPGEQTVDSEGSMIKIGGEMSAGLKSDTTVIARVTFRVLSTTENTVLRFHDYRLDGSGYTDIKGPRVIQSENGVLEAPPCIDTMVGCKGTPQPLLLAEPSMLNVVLNDQPTQASSSSFSSSAFALSSSASSSPSELSGENSTFSILKIQNLSVTSRDSSVFLGWNDLKSSELSGYNVYYGTISGQYMQRRAIPASSASLILRDLQVGVPYFFAVRGVNTRSEETDFSQEVSVIVGKPESATSPLSGGINTFPSNENDSQNVLQANNIQEINGSTGVSSTLLVLFFVSGLLGTAFAFRRYILLSSHVR